MANLFADGVEINIEDGHWRLYNTDGANSLSPFFDTLRGTGLMQYVPKFAEARGLPGTVLASDYIKAVVVGFDEQHKRWLLGLHLLVKDEEKPRFVELVRWPVGEDQEAATNSHQAGRILAEYIGAPLKLFGAKKTPLAQADGTKRPGVTGPLQPHHRVDIDPQRIKLKVDQSTRKRRPCASCRRQVYSALSSARRGAVSSSRMYATSNCAIPRCTSP